LPDPVATARGSDTIAANTSDTNIPTDSFSRVIGISRKGETVQTVSGSLPGADHLAKARC